MATDLTRTRAMVEMGDTGLERQAGFIDEEFLPTLKGEKGRKVFREMRDNDPVIGAVFFAIEYLVRSVSWDIEPGGPERADQQSADFLAEAKDDMSHGWDDLVSEILSMLTYGWSYHEVVYKIRGGDSRDPKKRSKYSDGRIAWRKMPIRAQESLDRWKLDDSGGVQGMWQFVPGSGQSPLIPIEKALLFRTSTHKNNPEGKSIQRNAYRPWFFKRNIEKIEAIGIERDLAGIPRFGVPPVYLTADATPAQKATLAAIKKMGRNLRRDEQHVIVVPLAYDERGNELFKFELMGPSQIKQFNTSEIIGRYDQRIAMTVLADFILIGHEKVGSLALHSDKTHLFAVALGAWLDAIADVFNTHAIPRLFRFNPDLRGELPRLVHGDIETPDLKELGEYISKLSGSGVDLFPDEQLENYLRRSANLPEKQPEGS